MRTMSQMVGASYRCRGISGATLGVRDCRRGVSVPARSLLAASILPESLTDRAVEIIDTCLPDSVGSTGCLAPFANL